jgi:hypothetical protein
VNTATEESEEGMSGFFYKWLNRLLNKTRIQDRTRISTPQSLVAIVGLIPHLVLPTLLQDIIDKADKWGNDGKSGRIDPFTEVYDVSCPPDVCQFVLFMLIPRMFSASFPHDRPNGYMPRPGKKWSRSQEDPGAVSDPPG